MWSYAGAEPFCITIHYTSIIFFLYFLQIAMDVAAFVPTSEVREIIHFAIVLKSEVNAA
jgi:hypothetical protein